MKTYRIELIETNWFVHIYDRIGMVVAEYGPFATFDMAQRKADTLGVQSAELIAA